MQKHDGKNAANADETHKGGKDMSAKTSTAERCMALSQKVLALDVGINSNKGAQNIFNQLCEYTAEFGADMIALNYLPTRTLRAQQAVDCVKCGQRVIYLLNLALREGMFEFKPARAALQMAIALENEANKLVRAYVAVPAPAPAAEPEEEPEETVAEEPLPERVAVPEPVRRPAPAPKPDPDGFDAPFEGDL